MPVSHSTLPNKLHPSPHRDLSFLRTKGLGHEKSVIPKSLRILLLSGTSQLFTRSTRHTVKSCDKLTVVSDSVVTSWPYFLT